MSAFSSKTATFASLPPPWPHDLMPVIREQLAKRAAKVVVLDDDPTGTQTVHDIPVLTEWSLERLKLALSENGPGFYILTNSRAFTTAEACRINREIGERLQTAAAATKSEFVCISRSDSTLRGHFPDEVTALSGETPLLLCPYFEAGGRYTIGDVHYVAEGDQLVPAGETPFAKDATFGFKASNLRDWVVEKSKGTITPDRIRSLSLDDIRQKGPEAIAEQLMLANGMVCIANAACQRDMEVVVLAQIMAESRGQRLMGRTAASYVATRMGLAPRPLLGGHDLARDVPGGGLIVVGSYVPKTTEQLQHLLDGSSIERVELNVQSLNESAAITQRVDALLSAGKDVVLYTSRQLVTGADADASLRFGQSVSATLVRMVSALKTSPRFFIAKGGITSSDLATRALGVKRALVRGQILPGIPVWQLGEESRFPGMNYVVFPGNVGGADALLHAYQKLTAS